MADKENAPSGDVIHCHEMEVFEKITTSGDSIVDFSATWCPPCRMMKPIFENLAKENPSIKFVHIDIDEAREKMDSKLKDVNCVPTFEVYKDGKLEHTFMGADVNELKKSLAKLKGEEYVEEVDDEEKKDEGEYEEDEFDEDEEENNGGESEEDTFLADLDKSEFSYASLVKIAIEQANKLQSWYEFDDVGEPSKLSKREFVENITYSKESRDRQYKELRDLVKYQTNEIRVKAGDEERLSATKKSLAQMKDELDSLKALVEKPEGLVPSGILEKLEKIQNSMQDIDNSLVVPKPVSAQTANLNSAWFEFKVNPSSDDKNKKVQIRYNTVKDVYYVSTNGQIGENSNETIKGWKTAVYKYSNMRHNVEQDWKMCYLARNETSKAFIEWFFRMESKSLAKIELKFDTDCFNSGKIKLIAEVLRDDGSAFVLPLSKESETNENQVNSQFANGIYKIDFSRMGKEQQSELKAFKIRAELSAGDNEIAAQLFRTSLADTEACLYDVSFYFE